MIIRKNLTEFSGVFEIVSADFLIDNDLKLWFTGFQTNPSYIWAGESSSRFYEMIIKESISIEIKIRNERLALIRKCMAEIHQNISDSKTSELNQDFAKKLKEDIRARGMTMQELNKFELIFDDNLEGNLKAMNKLPSTCKIL